MDGRTCSKRKVKAPQGEISTKGLTVTMEVETLDCPICLEPLRPPIFQCSVGHCICLCCHGKLLDKDCHICSIKGSFKRCFAMEHVVQSVTVPCSNAKHGCAEKVTYYQKEEHEKTCPNAPCFCSESSCGFAGPTRALQDHFTSQHKCPSTFLIDNETVSIRLQPGLHVLRSSSDSYFFLCSMISEPFGYAVSVICVQPYVTEPKFTCHMNYDCTTTSYYGSCQIRSSSLSDGLPTGYDLLLPKGKISDNRNGIMVRAKILQPVSLSRSCLPGKGRVLLLNKGHVMILLLMMMLLLWLMIYH